MDVPCFNLLVRLRKHASPWSNVISSDLTKKKKSLIKTNGQGFHVWVSNVLPHSRLSKEGSRPGVRSALNKEGKFDKITLLSHLERRRMGFRRTGLRRTVGLSAFPAISLEKGLLNSETTSGLNLKVSELKMIAGYQQYHGELSLHIDTVIVLQLMLYSHC